VKKIELSEDFFAASVSSDAGEASGDQEAMRVLMGRSRFTPTGTRPRKHRSGSANREAEPGPGMIGLLTLPFELTRNVMTVLVHLFRAAVPTFRRR
jgi:hypothetical protein